MLWRPRGRTELENEGQGRPKRNWLGCHLVWDWLQKQQFVFSICGVHRYSLCPLANEREIEVDIPIDLKDLSEMIKKTRSRGSHLFSSHRVLNEVVLPENHTLLLEDIIPPDTMHLPYTLPTGGPVLPPCFPAHRIHNIIYGATSWKRERASPVSDGSWITGCKHKRLKSRC